MNYDKIMEAAYADGGLLDALLSIQKDEGYVSEAAIRALAAHENISPAEMYDTASFYSMLRFAPAAKTDIRVCRGTACHSGGNGELISTIEKATGAKIGEASADGSYYLDYVECLGQCQDAPNMLVNGKLYTNVDIDKVADIIKEGGCK